MTATLITFPTPLRPAAAYGGWQLTHYSSHFARDGELITADTPDAITEAYLQPLWLEAPEPVRLSAKQVKDSSPCITPALMAAGEPRGHKAAGLSRVLFLDYDGDNGVTTAEREELLDCLRRMDRLFILHTTSSTPFLVPGKEKLRVVMPLMEPVDPEGYTRLWSIVNNHVERETGLRADSTKTHPGDLLYRPVFHRDHAARWNAWLHPSESLLWDVPVAERGETGAYERLRDAVNKNDVLFRVAYGLGRKAARESGAAASEPEQLALVAWNEELKRGLADNTVSAAVRDWAAAERTAVRKFVAGYRDESREQTGRTESYRLELLSELRAATTGAKVAEWAAGCGRPSKALSATVRRVAGLVAAELGMPAEELQSAKERLLGALGGKLLSVWESGLLSPVDPQAESREREQETQRVRGWQDLGLIFDVKGRPSASATNVIQVFNNDPALRGLFHRNCRSEADEVIVQRGFRGLATGEVIDLRNSKTGYNWFAGYLSEQWNIRDLSVEEYNAAIRQLLVELPETDPVVSYFDSLTSGCGVERLDTFFVRHGGAVDTPVTRAMTRSLFLSCVRTAYEPGAKTNLMWVLVGEQGIGKTQVLHALVCDERYFGTIESDEIAGGLSSDAGRKPRQTAARSMIVEVPEIYLQGKAVTMWKSFISDFTPCLRKPFMLAPQVLPRRSVLVATSNVPQVLKDSSGNRRFLPIELTRRIDLAAVREERDSLWAEAVRLYRLSPSESGVPEELWNELAGLQESFRAVSGVEEQLSALTNGSEGWPLADTDKPGSYKSSIGLRSEWLPVAALSGGGDTPRLLTLHQAQGILKCSQSAPVVAALTKVGWKYTRSRTFLSNSMTTRMWVHPKYEGLILR